MNKSQELQRGQVLLIVILVMVVTLTVGLSVVTRTVTTLRTSQEEVSSQQAFSAAEAGIEKIINSSSTSITGPLSNGATYSTSVASLQGTTFLMNNGNTIEEDDGADVWLSNYPSYSSPFTGTVTVYWGVSGELCTSDPTTNQQAALEIVPIAGTVAVPTATHYVLDPCAARASTNNFSTGIQAGGTINGKTFAHSFPVPLVNGLLMRIVPLYAPTAIGISGNGAQLPVQGQVIQSVGSSGETQRKVIVYKGYPKLPVELFPTILFSQ